MDTSNFVTRLDRLEIEDRHNHLDIFGEFLDHLGVFRAIEAVNVSMDGHPRSRFPNKSRQNGHICIWLDLAVYLGILSTCWTRDRRAVGHGAHSQGCEA